MDEVVIAVVADVGVSDDVDGDGGGVFGGGNGGGGFSSSGGCDGG